MYFPPFWNKVYKICLAADAKDGNVLQPFFFKFVSCVGEVNDTAPAIVS